MFNTSVSAAMHMVAQTNRALDVTLPSKLTSELDRLNAVTARGIDDNPTPLAGLIVDAALAGRDPLQDEQITDHAIRAALRTLDLRASIERELEDRRAALVHKHADSILKAWEPVITEAGEILGKARADMPTVDFRDPRAVVGLRAGQMSTWGMARDALDRVEKVGQTWGMLAAATGLANPQAGPRALLVADLDLDTLDSIGGTRAQAWQAASLGVPLALAGFEEFTARCRRIAEQRQKREDEARAKQPRRVGAVL